MIDRTFLGLDINTRTGRTGQLGLIRLLVRQFLGCHNLLLITVFQNLQISAVPPRNRTVVETGLMNLRHTLNLTVLPVKFTLNILALARGGLKLLGLYVTGHRRQTEEKMRLILCGD